MKKGGKSGLFSKKSAVVSDDDDDASDGGRKMARKTKKSVSSQPELPPQRHERQQFQKARQLPQIQQQQQQQQQQFQPQQQFQQPSIQSVPDLTSNTNVNADFGNIMKELIGESNVASLNDEIEESNERSLDFDNAIRYSRSNVALPSKASLSKSKTRSKVSSELAPSLVDQSVVVQKRAVHNQLKQRSQVRSVHLGVKEWMEGGYKHDCYPLHKIAQVLDESASEPNDHIVEIDLSGMDDVTDLFMCELMTNHRPGMKHVTDVVLNGCLNVTDLGVKWISRACGDTLRKISLIGCTRVTSHCLADLSRDCSKLNSLDVTGTGVNLVPKRFLRFPTFNAGGCYIMNNDTSQSPITTYRLIIVRDDFINDVTNVCLSNYLSAGNVRESVCFNHVTGWKGPHAGTYNMAEATADICGMFTTGRCLYLLPYDTSTVVKSPDALVERIMALVTRVPYCYIVMVGLGSGTESAKPTIDQKLAGVQVQLRRQIQTINKDDSSFDFYQQNNLVQAYALLDSLTQLTLTLSDVKLDTKNKTLSPEFVKEFEKFENFAIDHFPEYTQMNNSFILLTNKLERTPGLVKGQELIDKLTAKTKVLQKREENMAALRVMHDLGHALFLPALPGMPCVTDLTWLATVLNTLAAPPLPSGQLTYQTLHEAVKHWTDEALETAFKTEKKLSDVLDFLCDAGVLCQRRFVLLLNQLSEQPPPALEHHLPDLSSNSDCCVTWRADTSHVIPQTVLSTLIGRCLKLRPPVVLWRSGLVVHEGAVDCIIRRAESGLGVEVLVVCTSPGTMYVRADEKATSTVRDCMRSVLEQYALIVLATLKQYGVFALTSQSESGISVIASPSKASTSKKQAQTDPVQAAGDYCTTIPHHHVTTTDRAGFTRHVCEWCGLEGKNVTMLTELCSALRPSLYKHQSLRSLHGVDETGAVIRKSHPRCTITMRADQEAGLKSLTCLEPYGHSQYTVIAGQYFDTAVGVQSVNECGEVRRLFLSRDKLLLGSGAQAKFTELFTMRREDAVIQGDSITVKLTLSGKPDHYSVEFLKNGLLVCKADLPVADYVPFLAPAATYNASKPISENQQMRANPNTERTPDLFSEKDTSLAQFDQGQPVPEKDSVSHFILDLGGAPVIQEPHVLSPLDQQYLTMVNHAVEVYIPHSNADPLNKNDPQPDGLPAEYAVGTIVKTEPSRLSPAPKFTVKLGDGEVLENVPLNRLYPPGYRDQYRRRHLLDKLETGQRSHRLAQDEIYQNMINMNKDLAVAIPAEDKSDELTPIVRKPYTKDYITTITLDGEAGEEELQWFDWRRYLTDKQLQPACVDMFKSNNNINMEESTPLPGFHSRSQKQCRFLKNRPIVLEQNLSRLVSTLNKRRYAKHAMSFFMRDIPICLLPEMTSQTLLLPSRRRIQRSVEDLRFHLLCPAHDTNHFMNVAGLKLSPEVTSQTDGDYIRFLMCVAIFTNLQLLDQVAILPLNTNQLVTMETPLTQHQLEEGIRELLYLTLMTYTLYVSEQDVVQVLAKEKTTKLPLDSMKSMMEHLVLNKPPEHSRDEKIQQLVQMGVMRESGSRCTSCPAHTPRKSGEYTTIDMNIYSDFVPLITILDYKENLIKAVPTEVMRFENLLELNMSKNKLTELPSLNELTNLHKLYLSQNQLSTLPDLRGCVKLEVVNLSNNPLMTFPKSLLELGSLSFLNIGNTGMTSLPDNVGKLTSLMTLLCRGLTLNSLPDSFSKLTCLTTLDLSGLQWIPGKDKNAIMTMDEYYEFFKSNVILEKVPQEERLAMLGPETARKATLDHDDIQKVNAAIFKRFRRFYGTASSFTRTLKKKTASGEPDATEGVTSGFPEQLTQLTQLEYLNLSYQGLIRVPDSVAALKKLKDLVLTDNPQLDTISAELGDLPLESLSLQHCPVLKTPPREIVSKGFKVVYGYLRRLKMGSVSCKRTKLMMVGLGGAGKTSLVKALTVGSLQKSATEEESITDGIDITTWENTDATSGENVTFSVWDFAGQTVYYNTHQFFLSNRAIYLLLWNVRLGYEHAGLDFWCSSIACHAPKASILIVGSHCDKVENPELPVELMQKRYPQIKGFHYISCFDGTGVEKLTTNLLNIALNEKYMGERIPEAWLKFESKVLSQRSKSLLSWDLVHTEAINCGIIDDDDITNAVRFLHELGSLQHFNNERLKSRVVVDPQWIVDVMACVVSVHDNAVKNGVFHHSAMSTVWQQYPRDLYPWLLELTEEFDLTFRLKGKLINLVPCLLPNKEPQVNWPDVYGKPAIRENKIVYTFEYLPSGLFNRAQVRLCQFSDDSLIWRMGSFLKKNNHIAIVQQTKENELLVKVQGPRPENMLFFIHEVFESLIRESFHGVRYDYFIPCPDCLNAGLDPCMFSAAKIRRAIQFRAPFLQCDTSFHAVTMGEMKALKPPEGEADYDAHLKKTSRDLKGLQNIMSRDIFIYYCEADCPKSDEDKHAHPKRLLADLTKLGYKVLLPEKPSELELERETVSLKASELILFCMSNNFIKNVKCMEFFYYVVKILRRKYVILCIGENHDWRSTDIGFHVATDVYIDMRKGKSYDEQLTVLKDSLLRRISNKSRVYPPCFISYCWRNSRLAGTELETGLGWEDPRQIKHYLEENGVHCWMDTEKVMGRLFEDIAEGLRHAKLMIACISDEYVQSENCSLEFHFAATTLKIPIVVAVVGKGSKWQESGIGLRCVTRSQVDFRVESSLAHASLLARVQEELPTDLALAETPLEDTENCKISYTELFELGKRKFLRQVAHIAAGMGSSQPYPRLIVIDILPIVIPKAPSEQKEGEENVSEIFLDPVTNTFKMCYKLLCEHDEQWHVVEPVIEMKTMNKEDQIKFVESVSGYLARLLTLLDNSTLDLNILNTKCGNELTKIILDKCGEESPPVFSDEYEILREACMSDDALKGTRPLHRCQHSSRKIFWLCKEHQQLTESVPIEDAIVTDAQEDEESDAVFAEQILQTRSAFSDDIRQKTEAVTAKERNREKLVQRHLAAHSSGPDRISSKICCVQ